MGRTKEDPVQIQQFVYDPASESYKVKMVDTNVDFSLDADSGDSVQVQSRSFSIVATLNEEIDCSNWSAFCVYVKSKDDSDKQPIHILISPVDNGDSFWVERYEMLPAFKNDKL